MLKLSKSTKKTVVYETETYVLREDPLVTIEVSKQNGKISDSYIFAKENQIKKLKEDSGLDFRFYYFRNDLLKELSTKHFTDVDFTKFVIPFEEFKDEKEMDLNMVLCPYYSGHMVFRLSDLRPIPTVLHFDYIGGVENEHYYIDKALKHLEKHPFVLDVKKEEIPYYNRARNRTEGLVMRVLLSQKVSDKVWESVKDGSFPTCAYKDSVCCHYKKGLDPLGIKKFVKPEDVVKKEEAETEDETEWGN